MNDTNHKVVRPLAFEREILIGIGATLTLMLYAVLRYPASVEQGGLLSFLVSLVALLAYAGVALWFRRSVAHSLKIALEQGARVGLLLGIAAILNISLEDFITFSTPVRASLGVSMWGLMFLLFGIAGSATYQRVGSLRLAALSSVWSALVSTVTMVVYGFSIGLLFMSHLQRTLQGAYSQSGMTDPQGFVIQTTLSAASMHLLLTPFLAAVFGFFGGLLSARLRSHSRRAAVALAIGVLLLLGGGVMSIRFASSLRRSDRPPFILAGLLALGVSLASAHPVFGAVRRPTVKG